MENVSLVHELFAFEDKLVQQFHRHPFFQRFGRMSTDELHAYLIQKWFLSENFVAWYDRVINGLQDAEAREVLRHIIFDETPQDAPSHREDLLTDLVYIGVQRSCVLTAKPTRETLRTKQRLHDIISYREHDYDLQAMVTLRMAGEVLVAEEYRHVVPELETRFGLTPERSRFYAPHFYHDRKEGPQDTAMFSHTGSFESVLARMITDTQKLDVALRSAQKAYDARVSFYDQFTREYRILKAGQRAGLVLAAAALLAYAGVSLNRTSEREEYAAFLAANPTAAAFYVDADRRLIEQFQKTGDAHYLTNLGTFRAARDVWGDGP
jgi:pyrroloquinoline quinone (PQQ) biosynthesis protein C